MSQNNDYVPVFKYRGAVSKKDLLAQADVISDEEEDLDLSEILGKKSSKRKEAKSKPKTKAKLTKKSRSAPAASSDISSPPRFTSSNTNVISLDDDDDLPMAVLAPTNPNPHITQTLNVLQSSQNIIRSLQNSVQSPGPTAVIEDEPKDTIVIQVKEKETNQTLKFRIYQDDLFQKVVDNVIKYKDLTPDAKVVLKLDGIPLLPTQTPKELNMIDNDVVFATVTKPSQPLKNSGGNSSKTTTSAAVAIDDDDDVFESSSSSLKKSSDDLKLPLKPKEMSLPLKPEPSTSAKQELGKSASFSAVIEDEDEAVKLKIRMKGKTEPLKLKLGKNAAFAKLIDKCCSEWKLDPKKAKFTFDGDVLTRDSTPADHDMEDGDLIDVLQ